MPSAETDAWSGCPCNGTSPRELALLPRSRRGDLPDPGSGSVPARFMPGQGSSAGNADDDSRDGTGADEGLLDNDDGNAVLLAADWSSSRIERPMIAPSSRVFDSRLAAGREGSLAFPSTIHATKGMQTSKALPATSVLRRRDLEAAVSSLIGARFMNGKAIGLSKKIAPPPERERHEDDVTASLPPSSPIRELRRQASC